MDIQQGLKYFHSLTEWRGNRKFDLESIRPVLRRLGNPQDAIKTSQIAGTNGKGSVSAALAGILAASGRRVGLNTSPHLGSIHERIIIDGVPVSDDFLGRYSIPVKLAADEEGVDLSLFEAMMAISAVGFASEGVDFAVYEVGLGGAFDATTSIARPEVCGIVTIGFDHMELLGGSLAEIARAKAGVIRSGGTVVSGKIADAPLQVIVETAQEKGARHVAYGRDYQVVADGGAFRFVSAELGEMKFKPALQGAHQVHNMAVAIAMARVMELTPAACRVGVQETFWPGRLERTYLGSRECVVDCAHNPDGIASLVEYLSGHGFADLVLGFGVLNGRDWQGMLSALLPFVSECHLLLPQSDRAVPVSEVGSFLGGRGMRTREWGEDYDGFVDWLSGSTDVRPVLICGSMYLVGGVRKRLVPEWRPLWKKTKNTAS